MGNTTGMVTVFLSMHLERVAAVAARLEAAGIPTHVQNAGLVTDMHISAMIWATPFVEVPLEQADEARAIVAGMLADRPSTENDAPILICATCREENPGDFEVCWSCGQRLGDDDEAGSA